MELSIFASFQALDGKEDGLASELRATATRVLTEEGCLAIGFYRSVRDSRLFWLHARWVDEEAFENHAKHPDTTKFLDRVQQFIGRLPEVSRTHLLS
jgi:quinol monooxygenase YgiN